MSKPKTTKLGIGSYKINATGAEVNYIPQLHAWVATDPHDPYAADVFPTLKAAVASSYGQPACEISE